jgi:hypothetical protein
MVNVKAGGCGAVGGRLPTAAELIADFHAHNGAMGEGTGSRFEPWLKEPDRGEG